MTLISQSEEDTVETGRKLGAYLKRGSVVALRGDLGAGKTVFVRGLAEGLGIFARITSPTFTIVNEYSGNIPLFHFDMYRISGSGELFDIGWEDYSERNGVCVVEWSENIDDSLPDDTVRVTITKTGDNSRVIEITGLGESI